VILNERQLRTSQKRLRETESNSGQLRSGAGELEADDRRAAMASLEAFATQLRHEIAEYDALRSGATPMLSISTLDELPLALIRARIAQQLTQAQLADRLGMKEQQLQRYEMQRYSGASLERLGEVATALGLNIEGSATVKSPPTEHFAIWRKPLILLALDLLHSHWNRPAQGALELQKILFNVDQSLRSKLHFHAFEFEPYKLGPYDPFLEDDIERLAVMRLVDKQIDVAAVKGDQVLIAELRTVPLATTAKAHEWLVSFESGDKIAPAHVKVEVRQIVDSVTATYGGLGLSDLIARTYAEHPDMTTRSAIREEMAKRAEGHGW